MVYGGEFQKYGSFGPKLKEPHKICQLSPQTDDDFGSVVHWRFTLLRPGSLTAVHPSRQAGRGTEISRQPSRLRISPGRLAQHGPKRTDAFARDSADAGISKKSRKYITFKVG